MVKGRGLVIYSFLLVLLSKTVLGFTDSPVFEQTFGLFTLEFMQSELWVAGIFRLMFFALLLSILLLASQPIMSRQGSDKNTKKYVKTAVTIIALIAGAATPIETIIVQAAYLGLVIGLIVPTLMIGFPFLVHFKLAPGGGAVRRFFKGLLFAFFWLLLIQFNKHVNSDIFAQLAGRPVGTNAIYEWIMGMYMVVAFLMALYLILGAPTSTLWNNRAGRHNPNGRGWSMPWNWGRNRQNQNNPPNTPSGQTPRGTGGGNQPGGNQGSGGANSPAGTVQPTPTSQIPGNQGAQATRAGQQAAEAGAEAATAATASAAANNATAAQNARLRQRLADANTTIDELREEAKLSREQAGRDREALENERKKVEEFSKKLDDERKEAEEKINELNQDIERLNTGLDTLQEEVNIAERDGKENAEELKKELELKKKEIEDLKEIKETLEEQVTTLEEDAQDAQRASQALESAKQKVEAAEEGAKAVEEDLKSDDPNARQSAAQRTEGVNEELDGVNEDLGTVTTALVAIGQRSNSAAEAAPKLLQIEEDLEQIETEISKIDENYKDTNSKLNKELNNEIKKVRRFRNAFLRTYSDLAKVLGKAAGTNKWADTQKQLRDNLQKAYKALLGAVQAEIMEFSNLDQKPFPADWKHNIFLMGRKLMVQRDSLKKIGPEIQKLITQAEGEKTDDEFIHIREACVQLDQFVRNLKRDAERIPRLGKIKGKDPHDGHRVVRKGWKKARWIILAIATLGALSGLKQSKGPNNEYPEMKGRGPIEASIGAPASQNHVIGSLITGKEFVNIIATQNYQNEKVAGVMNFEYNSANILNFNSEKLEQILSQAGIPGYQGRIVINVGVSSSVDGGNKSQGEFKGNDKLTKDRAKKARDQINELLKKYTNINTKNVEINIIEITQEQMVGVMEQSKNTVIGFHNKHKGDRDYLLAWEKQRDIIMKRNGLSEEAAGLLATLEVLNDNSGPLTDQEVVKWLAGQRTAVVSITAETQPAPQFTGLKPGYGGVKKNEQNTQQQQPPGGKRRRSNILVPEGGIPEF